MTKTDNTSTGIGGKIYLMGSKQPRKRCNLGNITSPSHIKDIMGYEQMDLYFPIAIKGDVK